MRQAEYAMIVASVHLARDLASQAFSDLPSITRNATLRHHVHLLPGTDDTAPCVRIHSNAVLPVTLCCDEVAVVINDTIRMGQLPVEYDAPSLWFTIFK